jgi:signal transduction histidine kinase
MEKRDKTLKCKCRLLQHEYSVYIYGMKKLCFILMIAWLMPFCLHGQTRQLDSIKALIGRHPQKDTTRVSLIMDYVVAAVNENTTQLLPFLDELISISKEQKYTRGLQSAYMTAQIYYSDRGDFTNAMPYADSAFMYLNADTSKRAMIQAAFLHNNLGGDYIKLGDYEKSVVHYTKAAQLLEQYKPEVLATVYSGLAEVHERLQQTEKAMEYDEKAIAAAEKTGNKSSIAKRYLNYVSRHINQKKFDKAKQLLKKIEPSVMQLEETFLFHLFYQNRGYVFQHKKMLDNAIADFKKAYRYALEADDKYQQQSVLDPLAACLTEAGKLQEAKIYADSLLAQSIRFQMPFARVNAFSNLAKWHEAIGDYKTANGFLEKKMALADSISSGEMKEKIAMLETRFKVQSKDNEIKILQGEKKIQQLNIERKNTFNYILLGAAAALLIISLLGYRSYHSRQKLQQQRINELETEKKLMATEAVLKGEEQERTRLAKDLHDGLGGMLSGIKYSFNTMKGNLIMTPDNAQAFERSMDMLDSSIQEMRRVAHNMMPEALVKFGLDTALKDFCNDISQSGALTVSYQSIGLANASIDQTTAITIYRIVQELMNNTMKHAAAKNAIVQLSKIDGILSLTVEDDGKGFDTAVLNISKGIGWDNIKNRVELLKGKLDVSAAAGKGTSVHLEIAV